jgi:hypothetical protein
MPSPNERLQRCRHEKLADDDTFADQWAMIEIATQNTSNSKRQRFASGHKYDLTNRAPVPIRLL